MIENKTADLLLPYFEAGYPVIALETCEERRVVEDCCARLSNKDDWKDVYTISSVGGLMQANSNRQADKDANFSKAFTFISSREESLLLVFDFQHLISSPQQYRSLLQALPACKSRGSMIVLVAPTWTVPAELKHEAPVVRLPLPTPHELNNPLGVVAEQLELPSNFRAEEYLASASGLTLAEAENVFALSGRVGFSKEIVEQEKMRLVRSGYMSVEKPRNPDQLGGLSRLKAYIRDEAIEAKDDDQLRVRGVLLVGVPGTGKSLSARVIASLLQWPLVRMDLSACKGSLVGQSEANTRNGLAMADAIAPCVLWLDEVEKTVGGYASSSSTDGGTTSGMVGTVLTWMQEHESPVLVVATCNDFQKLPAEMTRAGRFDERFFLDLPPYSERLEIAEIHLKRLGCGLGFAQEIAHLTGEWTGAEIEQLIKSAARISKRKLQPRVIKICAEEIIPISKTASIKQLREWASTNLRRANDGEEAAPSTRRVKHAPDPKAN